MADKKISQLPKINLISGSEVILPIVHDGTTQKMDVSTFAVFTSQWSATTGSNTFIGNQTITGNTSIGGNLTVAGKLTAQELFTEITSASIIFESGSTIFGNSGDDTHQFSGSISINGKIVGNAPLDFTSQSLNTQTGSQDLVNRGISSVTGSINTTTSSFNSVFLGISSVTGAINTTTSSFDSVFLGISSFTGSLNSLTGSYATTGSNTFRGNQSITGSLSVSAGEFNVTTGSGNMTSSLIFDHTQNDGVTLGLRHNDRLSLADHTFNIQVWAGGVYTTFVRNGTPYSILNVEAFDDNKIYLYRDTRLYNKSLVIDNNLTVQKDVVIGTGSLDINNGEFSITSGSGELTSSLSFTHTTVDPITGDATLALRYRNNDVGPENNAWRFVATDNGVQVRYDQYTTTNKLLFSVSSFGSNFDKLLIWRDARLYGTGLTVDDSLLVKGVITGSLLSTNGVVSSSNQLFELNAFTASVIGQTNTIAAFTSSVNFTTQSLNTQTGSQNSLNTSLGLITSSIYGEITSFNSVFQRVSSTTGSMNAQSSSQDLVNYQNSIVTSSFRNEIAGIEAYTASLKSAIVVNGNNVRIIGELTASRIYTEFITSSVLFVTGSNIIGDQSTDKHEFTGSVNINDTLFIKGQAIGLGELNAFSGSQIGKDFTLSVLTSSIDAHILKQAIQTGSQDLVNLGISTYTGSQNVINSSVDSHILKQAIQTGSQDLVNLGISTQTGSQDLINFNISVVTSSIDTHILKQSTQTGSQDLVNLGISTFTGSLRSEVNLIEAYTASLKGAAIVSSSQQITNYYKFAETASANTFYGNQTFASSGGSGLRVYGGAGTHQWDMYLNGQNIRLSDNTAGDGALIVDTRAYFGGHVTASANLTANKVAIGSTVTPTIPLEVYGQQKWFTTTGDGSELRGLFNPGGAADDSQLTLYKADGTTAGITLTPDGINFSANANAAGMTSELLNDYEEGTWTPGLSAGTSGTITVNTGNSKASYTKIGRAVTLQCFIEVSSVSSPVGRLSVTGFPFTAGSNLGDATAAVYNTGFTGNPGGWPILRVQPGTTAFIDIQESDGTNPAIDLSDHITTGTELIFSVTYFV